MKTVRFTRDTDPAREGGAGFKAGEVHSLRDGSAKRWVIRGAAEYVKVEQEPAAPDAKPAADAPKVDDDKQEGAALSLEPANGNTLESAADVAGQDGGDSGERTESDAGAVQPRRRGRPPVNRD